MNIGLLDKVQYPFGDITSITVGSRKRLANVSDDYYDYYPPALQSTAS